MIAVASPRPAHATTLLFPPEPTGPALLIHYGHTAAYLLRDRILYPITNTYDQGCVIRGGPDIHERELRTRDRYIICGPEAPTPEALHTLLMSHPDPDHAARALTQHGGAVSIADIQ